MRTLMILIGVWAGALSTQTPHDPLTIATVVCAPILIATPDGRSCFSIDLMDAASALF
jgi:hypothetical protein